VDALMEVVAPIALGALAVTMVGPLIGAAGGLASVPGAAIAGAAGTVGTSLAATGSVRLKDVLRGAATAALTAGLTQAVGSHLKLDLQAIAQNGSLAERALLGAGQASIRGAVQMLLGGSFREGFTQGVVSALAGEVLRGVMAGAEQLSPGEQAAARTLARLAAGAVRAAANGDDPLHGAAVELLQGLVGDVMPAPPVGADAPVPQPGVVTGTVFDDDGNLMPGWVDSRLPAQQQAEQLVQALVQQGMDLQSAVDLAAATVDWSTPIALQPASAAASGWTAEELQQRIEAVEQHVQAELAAQQAREDSLLGADELADPTGGGGSRAPVQAVTNGRFDAALNAASDGLGLLQPMQEMRAALGQLQDAQAQGRIEAMRELLRRAGVAGVPSSYEMAWGSDGVARRDYAATMALLQQSYETHLQTERMRQNWGPDWQHLRLGNKGLTVQQFEQQVLRVQQEAANAAYQEGVEAIARGQLPLRNGDYALTLGMFVDKRVRDKLRDYGRANGFPDSNASTVFAINRRISGSGMIGIPDLRIGAGLLSDVTLSRKDGTTDQLQRWNAIRPNDTIVLRPEQLGGSYVVPRTTIGVPKVAGRGG
jgi:hypothetical protein